MSASRRIYIATSFRNLARAERARRNLCDAGHCVFAFWKEPGGWERQADLPGLKDPDIQRFRRDPEATALAIRNLNGIRWADDFVLVRPCGASSHHELGLAEGMGKRCYVLDENWTGGLEEIAYLALHVEVVESVDELISRLTGAGESPSLTETNGEAPYHSCPGRCPMVGQAQGA